MRAVTKSVDKPVCMAGSIDSTRRLDEVSRVGAWSFTIGSAFFEHKFGDDFADQVNFVCEHIKATEDERKS